MSDAVLVINSGSSSIKFAAYPIERGADQPLITGKIGGIGRGPDFVARDQAGNLLGEGVLEAINADAAHGELVTCLLDWMQNHHKSISIVAAGHRVVHGGRGFTGPTAITAETLAQMKALTPLAPLHQPHNLAAVETIAKRAPDVFQVACFDTSFHRTQPRLAQLFGLPRKFADEGMIRYGFHGLSYQYIASVLPQVAGERAEGRVIVAHLGNGASICAMKERQSIATSMGFTALHGLLMGRRSGTLDAGAVLHLLQQQNMSVDEVHQLLYRQSGLLGVSGISNNMKQLQESDSPEAREAIDLFCYRAACEFGSHIAALEGLDAIVFTGGIGENSSLVRAEICKRLNWLGIELNATANETGEQTITTQSSAVGVHVVPTNEELVIARATRDLA